jgi:hypothetical protein
MALWPVATCAGMRAKEKEREKGDVVKPAEDLPRKI